MEDGVWRTVGGRRIFIKDGEDLSSAMKKSGKFKSGKKKNNVEDVEKQYIKKVNDAKNEEELKKADNYYKEKTGKDIKEQIKEQNEKFEKELKEKYMNIPEEERVKAYEEGKNWKDLVKEKELNINSKFKNAPADIQKNVSDFEKAGLKVDDAFETDLYGNGKEDRFMLKDGRYIAHTKEAFGQKEDSWSLEQNYDKDGNYNPKSTKFESYDDMIKHLGGSKKETYGNSSMFKFDKPEQQNLKTYSGELKDQNIKKSFDRLYGMDKMDKVSREEFLEGLKKQNRISQSDYDSLKRTYGSNQAYKSAYEDYKKKHPNSKITLNQFIDMSEGK